MRQPGRWALIGGLLAIVVAAALFDPYLFTGGDNAAYYALTKALAEGRGYVDIITPGSPPETLYPPGYPAYLVPFFFAFGGSMIGLKLASLLAGAGLLLAIWLLARSDPAIEPWVGAATVWLVGLSTLFLTYTHLVLSDMAFTAAAFVALWLFSRASSPGERRGRVDGAWLVALVVALAAFYIRTAGVSLFAAALAWAVWHRRWRRSVMTVAIAIVGAAPWLWWSARKPPRAGSYLDQLSSSNRQDPESPAVTMVELAERVMSNLVHYASVELPQLLWPFRPSPPLVRAVGTITLLALIALGLWTLWRKRGPQVWDLYLGATTALIVVWPWIGNRFFLTIVPAVWLVALTGLDRITGGTRRPWAGPVIAGAVAAILLVGALRTVPIQWRYTRAYMDGDVWVGYDGFWQDYFQAARWIAEDDPRAVILARKPTLAWYWSRRASVVYPFHGDPEATWRFVRESGVTHILAEPLTQAFLGPMIADRSGVLDLVYAGPYRDVFVLRVAPEP